MANVWGHKYPDNLTDLLVQSEQIANEMLGALRKDTAPLLCDLYKKTDKVYRQKKVFERLGLKPNRKSDDKVKSNNELMGLYVFGIENSKKIIEPVYIGISRTVYRRLRQHGWGSTHNQCTFAYMLADEKHHNFSWKGRSTFPENQLEESRKFLQKCRVAIFPITEDKNYEMYFHEVAIAGLLKTRYNTFKTH